MKIKMVKDLAVYEQTELYRMRTQLVKAIDPLTSERNELQSILMACNKIAMGETNIEELVKP